VSIDDVSHVVTFGAQPNWHGNENITFTATDLDGLSDNDTITVTVTPVNDPPSFDPLTPDVSFAEDGSDNSIDLDDYVSDPDHTNAQLTLVPSGNANVTVSIDPVTHVVTLGAQPNWYGNEEITFTATDPAPDFLSASDTFTVAVTPVNDPPSFGPPIPDVSFAEDGTDSSIDLDDYVSDPDHTNAQLTLVPSGNTNVTVSIDPVTHVVTFGAQLNWHGNEDITFTATDPDLLSDNDTITVTVDPAVGINVSGKILVRRVSDPLLNRIPLFSRFSSQLSIRPVTLLNIDGSFIFVSLRLLLGSVVKHSDSTISGSYSLLNVTPDVEYTRSVTPLLGGPPWTLVSAEQVTYDPEEDVTNERIYVRSGTFMILCPVELHVYNSDGEHTGANDTGIPLSLYDEYEDIKSGDTAKVITIINPDDVYQIKVVGIDDGTCNLLVSNYITVNNEDFLAEIYLEDMHYLPTSWRVL